MLAQRVSASASRMVALRASRKAQQGKRTFATNENKVLTDTYKKMAEEIAKADQRNLEKLFYETFPEAAENPTDANVKAMKTAFTAIYNAASEAFEKNPASVGKGMKRFTDIANRVIAESTSGNTPVKVAVTGATGNIGYALLFRIASGAMFGETTPVQLHLLDLPAAQNALKGVIMELQDGAYPLLRGVSAFDDATKAFVDIDAALLVGAKPRTKGMERGDLLMGNAEIFSVQGKALNQSAKKSVKVAVVGNPANTNAMIAQRNAPSIPAENFTAMTRLDHNRALAQLSAKTGAHVSEVSNFAIWGNHSPTMYPCLAHATIKGRPATEVINDNDWIVKTFIPEVQQRGAAIIAARGASSAASAASALVDHMRDWTHGTAGEWASVGVISKGEYGVTPGLNFSYPIVHVDGKSQVVQNLPIDAFSAERLEATHKELLAERDAVAKMLPK